MIDWLERDIRDTRERLMQATTDADRMRWSNALGSLMRRRAIVENQRWWDEHARKPNPDLRLALEEIASASPTIHAHATASRAELQPEEAMNDIPGASLSYARLEPEFARLCAALGWRIKTTDHWLGWERLVGIYGWNRLLRAVERCEPGHRWPADAEKVCREFAKQEADAAKQAAQDAANTEMKEKAKAKGRLVKVGDKWVVQDV